VFENLNVWELGALVLLALLIFGDKLPEVISDGLKMLRNLRNMARNATTDLSRELGTDIQLEDLHPKTFIRKHLLSEEDEDALRKPLQGLYDDLKGDLNSVKGDLNSVKGDLDDVAKAVDPRVGNTGKGSGLNGPNGSPVNGSAIGGSSGGSDAGDAAKNRRHSFDADAT
jgi:sec-independent protein translocase protein TatB